MGSDILQQHKRLLDELDFARKKLQQAELALFENETELAKAIRKNPLMRHIGLVGPENDLSDFLGSDLDEKRPSIDEKTAENFMLPLAQQPSMVTEILIDDPAENFFSAYPYLALADSLTMSTQATGLESVKDLSPHDITELASTDGTGNDTSFIVPEDAARATHALNALQAGIWEWDALTEQIYTSPYWDKLMGEHVTNKGVNPFDALASLMDTNDAAIVTDAMTRLGEGKIENFRLRIRHADKNDQTRWIELSALCVRNEAAEMRRMIFTAVDITDEQEAQLKTQASLDRLRTINENSPDLVIKVNAEGLASHVGQSINHYFPGEVEQREGKPLTSFMPEVYISFFMKNIQQVFSMGIPIQTEKKFYSPFVGEFSAECSFLPETAENGKIIAVTVLLRDLDKTHRMTEDYNSLFNSMQKGFALFRHMPKNNNEQTDADNFILISINPALGNILHINPSNAMGKQLSALTRNSEEWLSGLHQVLTTNAPHTFTIHSDLFSSIIEVCAYSPGMGKVACIIKDITALYEYEKNVQMNETRFSALHSLSQMYGATEDEFIRLALEQITTLTDSPYAYLYLLSPTKAVHWYRANAIAVEEEISAQLPKGQLLFPLTVCKEPSITNTKEYVPIASQDHGITFNRYMAVPLMENGHMACMAVVAERQHDYTAADLRQLVLLFHGVASILRRRWAISSLEQAKNLAEKSCQEKNEFLTVVGDEMHTPLNDVLSTLQLLKQSPLTKEQQEWISVASHSGQKLLHLVTDIFKFSKIEPKQ